MEHVEYVPVNRKRKAESQVVVCNPSCVRSKKYLNLFSFFCFIFPVFVINKIKYTFGDNTNDFGYLIWQFGDWKIKYIW